MSISGVLTQAQATDLNLATSVRQWLVNNVVTPYNTEAGMAGAQLQPDGSWVADVKGLGIIESMPDDEALYERVPVLAYALDYKVPKSPVSTGMGDGSSWEYRSIAVCCLPAITIATDDTIQPNRLSQWILKTHVANAVTRTNVLPIVDHAGAQSGGNYPQIGYAEIINPQIHSMERIQQLLGPNRYRFDAFFEIRWAVATTN